ncbi:MAG: autotransporter outer membrane beta-barrel domain-containing protein, partial [Rhizobiaceae bacterium]|nr:autotransporter outer membrane beta-barrel domain-containing protein [Rhizobiaceae bacterium]
RDRDDRHDFADPGAPRAYDGQDDGSDGVPFDQPRDRASAAYEPVQDPSRRYALAHTQQSSAADRTKDGGGGAAAADAEAGEDGEGFDGFRGYDVWLQGGYTFVDRDSGGTDVTVFQGGVDYRFDDRAVVGVMGQLDISSYEGSENGIETSADGVGFLVGPYAVVRLDERIYAEGRVLYGWSYNTVDALGLFEDDFTTDRLLVMGQVTGDFDVGMFNLNPFAKVTYYWENAHEYTDSLLRTIPEQTFKMGQFQIGPKISTRINLDGGVVISPHVSLTAAWNFESFDEEDPAEEEEDSVSGRVSFGTKVSTPSGLQLTFDFFYDGIGRDDHESYGGTASLTMPF